jgi:hypothetical protein
MDSPNNLHSLDNGFGRGVVYAARNPYVVSPSTHGGNLMYELAPAINGLKVAAKGDIHLRDALRKASTPDEIVYLAYNYGYRLTAEEVASAIKASQCPDIALEVVELEAVANNDRTDSGTCANSCGCNSTETCSNCCRR